MAFKGDQQLLQIITTEFIEKFNALNNTVADVQIKHLLYGNQKIKRCILHPFVDGDCIGLIINEEKKYIMVNELRNAYFDNENCYMQSDVMEIFILN